MYYASHKRCFRLSLEQNTILLLYVSERLVPVLVDYIQSIWELKYVCSSARAQEHMKLHYVVTYASATDYNGIIIIKVCVQLDFMKDKTNL